MARTTYLHSGWQFVQTRLEGKQIGVSRVDWLPANVPGHVHLDLASHGIIAHPFERMNELGCQWVDAEEWSYKTSFEWTADPELSKRVLRFEGLDTICTVLLNGVEIAKSDNMFLPVEVDVTDRLQEGTNEIRIDFLPAAKVGEERRAAYFEAEGLPADTGAFTERSFVRKAQYMYGWDWGPRLVSCGVWKPVKLIEFAARILDVHVSYETLDGGAAKATITTEFEGDAVPLHVLLGWAGEPFLSPDGSVILEDVEGYSPEDPDATRTVVATVLVPKESAEALAKAKAAVRLDGEIEEDDEDPVVWDMVRTALESIEDVEGVEAVLDSLTEEEPITVLDYRKVRCDYRDIELVREPDEYGESFTLTVNGEEVYVRGANWIPDHSFPSVISREQIRKQLERCLDLNINLLRVWGGGMYESDDFYELCDEMGILVWQDFPFACGFYPDNGNWVEPFKSEAIANIKRLRNHPSLALWCGNNENHQCYGERWAGDHTPPRFYGTHFYDELIPDLLASLDPGRPYTAGSACGPKANPLEHVNKGGYGDSHYWDVWHGRGDWRFYADSTSRFSSEFGFVSSCAVSTWAKYIDEEDWDAYSPVVKWHDKTGKGYDNYLGLVKLHYPAPQTLEDLVYYTQLNQRDALRFGIEHFRRAEFCKGTIIWQINDCWPVQSWAFIDNEGNYKALAYELRRLYSDLLLSIKRDEENVQVWLVNDGGVDMDDLSISLTAHSTLTGETLKTWEGIAGIEAHSRSAALVASVSGLNVNETLLVAEIAGQSTWQLLGEPKSTRFAEPAPILISTAPDGALHLRVDGPVVDLQLLDNGSTEPFETNYLTLPEGGDVIVPVLRLPEAVEARSLAGTHPIRITRSPI